MIESASLLFHAVVPGKPVPGARVRVPRFGKAYYPKTTKEYRTKMTDVFAEGWHPLRDHSTPINQPVEVEVWVSGPRKNSDLDNYSKSVLDSLVDAGVLEDDNVSIVKRLVLEVDEGCEPRLAVFIYRYGEGI